jgi:acyl-CoA synthetase (AMP-forming)/AMP-acid ligase II
MPFSTARNAMRSGKAPVSAKQRKTLLAVPFYHVIVSLSVLLPNMAAGGKLVLMRKFDAEEALTLIARERITVAGGVPAIALALLEQAEGHDLSSLELVTYGGAPCPVSLAEEIRARLHAMPGQGWGMTETSATCTTHSGQDYLHRPASCGPALPVYRLKVMQDGTELPAGRPGELWAFGPNIVKGYWNRPEATAERFQGGWVRTGDLAVLDAEGFCTILDRAEDMLIRGGENIYCTEIEDCLASHPAVLEAAVVGLPDADLGERVAAAVVARSEVSTEELLAFARERLSAYKRPRQIALVASLPRNAMGQLQRTAVKTLLDQG